LYLLWPAEIDPSNGTRKSHQHRATSCVPKRIIPSSTVTGSGCGGESSISSTLQLLKLGIYGIHTFSLGDSTKSFLFAIVQNLRTSPQQGALDYLGAGFAGRCK